MEKRCKLRRLACLGVVGHQTGIAGHVKMSQDEKHRIAEAILAQKSELIQSRSNNIEILNTEATRMKG